MLGFRVVCAVELDPYCREVLLRRQEEGHMEPFPMWNDAITFDGRPWRGVVDVVTAGFPCQPFSVAGQQDGKDDERNLWPETIRIIREVEPRYAILENVPGLLSHDYYGEIIGGLASAGYDAEWGVISAAEVGAPHLRKRLWVAAHLRASNAIGDSLRELGQRGRKQHQKPGATQSTDDGQEGPLANADIGGCQGEREPELYDREREAFRDDAHGCGGSVEDADANGEGLEGEDEGRPGASTPRFCWWATEPGMGRVAHGVAHRMDRLKAIGNGQVPAVVREAWHRLAGGGEPH
jgi:DNA (cytosine-5)-methyltransferase 1